MAYLHDRYVGVRGNKTTRDPPRRASAGRSSRPSSAPSRRPAPPRRARQGSCRRWLASCTNEQGCAGRTHPPTVGPPSRARADTPSLGKSGPARGSCPDDAPWCRRCHRAANAARLRDGGEGLLPQREGDYCLKETEVTRRGLVAEPTHPQGLRERESRRRTRRPRQTVRARARSCEGGASPLASMETGARFGRRSLAGG